MCGTLKKGRQTDVDVVVCDEYSRKGLSSYDGNANISAVVKMLMTCLRALSGRAIGYYENVPIRNMLDMLFTFKVSAQHTNGTIITLEKIVHRKLTVSVD